MLINDVGVRALKLPVLFDEDSIKRPSVGEWSVSTNLPAERRGTHMSRLVRILHDTAGLLSYPGFCRLPDLLCSRLDATACFVSVHFTYFMEKAAPISGEKGLLDIGVRFVARREASGDERFLMQVVAPVTSLCPCSKAISKYGAHNQRSHITLSVEPRAGLLVRDLVAMAETGASSELFSILKRVDERHVTEQAYSNPKFVEDIVRDLAVSLQRAEEIRNYRIEAENFESIHNHSAYAVIESDGYPRLLR